MAVSVFDLFKIGIGPSSSHTVGPMRAARLFVQRLAREGHLPRVARVRCTLYGSLGATGRGHGSDRAVLLGLCGHAPDTVDVDAIEPLIARICARHRLPLADGPEVAFDEAADLLLVPDVALPLHANGMRFEAFDAAGGLLDAQVYYSVGGGFIVSGEAAVDARRQAEIAPDTEVLPLPFHSGEQLLAQAAAQGGSMARVMRVNERHWRTDSEIDAGLLAIWGAMQDCVARGCRTGGVLPGGFRVRRRAPALHQALQGAPDTLQDPLQVIDWVNLFALAVNEENAAGGRVVTAPTNGAAGIVPAVLHYYWRFIAGASEAGVIDFLLTAGAIGILYKENASISGAEVGCQGEVGVACSMAAAGLCAVLGGMPAQVENAAEIGMEHHLGLTCDPVGGLVQIPCIERNALAAVKAINAARMALRGDGTHHVSLDQVIKTMRETGADMMSKYKETSRGGLAVNIVEC
ncbi:L-serine ammonia-lyase [Alicycliphilus denitrificans]|uniref:L-serine dehydratase n=1 Tax=Alicycliphilus denitrificans TaxID=179636 RepID=A0A858ZND8_9BURK|nr:L-serine ammonia-lyase [Alicycliphilus denitrificans]QKD42244.1 L-serine ammonia-lyase [Alicycliphilus denitrificans]GAO25845.1 L-serine dehydratase 1 [Alicycliphilus sp. B1]